MTAQAAREPGPSFYDRLCPGKRPWGNHPGATPHAAAAHRPSCASAWSDPRGFAGFV